MARLDDVKQAHTDLEQKISDALDREIGQIFAKLDELRQQVAPNLQVLVDEAKGMGERLTEKIDAIVADAEPDIHPPQPEGTTPPRSPRQ